MLDPLPAFRLASFLMVLGVSGSSAAAQSDDGSCFTFSWVGSDGSIGFDRAGEALTDDQACGVDAAIDLLRQLEAAGCLGGADGGSSGVPISDLLQDIRNDGGLCCERIADPATVAASTSNPNNAPPDDTWQDGNRTFQQTGHPGINVQEGRIPVSTFGGSVVFGGKAFDSEAVSNLAWVLLHESSHLTNPGQGPEKGDYEDPATEFTIEQLCQIAACNSPLVTPQLQRSLCEAIQSQNQQRQSLGLDCVDCSTCAGLGIDPKLACTPPPPPPPSGYGPVVGGQALDAAREFQWYVGTSPTGFLILDRGESTLTFQLRSDLGDWDHVLDLEAISAGFRAASLLQMDETELLVLGENGGTGGFEALEVVFDPLAGVVLSGTSVLQSTQTGPPGHAALYRLTPSLPVVFLVEESTQDLLVYLPNSGFVGILATAALVPGLQSVEFVRARPILDGLGYAVIVSSVRDRDLTSMSMQLPIEEVVLLDYDANGVIDGVL